jgi:hypothetical protein
LDVKQKVTIVTNGDAWAEQSFSFAWGESQIADRLRALEALIGTQADLIRMAQIEPTAYKMALKRNSSMPAERIGAIAKATGVSLDYLIWGTPVNQMDAACEEKRFDLAAQAFATPSSKTKRDARHALIAKSRAEVEDKLAAFSDAATMPADQGDNPVAPPEGFVQVPHLLARGGRADPAPVALSAKWLKQQGLIANVLAFVKIEKDEGGPQFPPGSIVLVDRSETALQPGVLLALDFGGEVQLRRLVRRLDGRHELVHVNPAWPMEPVDEPQAIKALGRVAFAFLPV